MTRIQWMVLTVFLFLFTLVSPVASSDAATYYVDPGGSDLSGSGSAARPWRTLSKACSVVRTSGDRIQVNAGSYTDSAVCTLAVGVSIEGAGKGVTTITTSVRGYYISAVSPTFVDGGNTISGITFRGGSSIATRRGDGCIRFQRRHNSVVHDCDILYFEAPSSRDGNAVEFLGEIDWDAQNTTPPAVWMDGCKLYNCRIVGCHRNDLFKAAVTVLGLSNLEIHDNVFDETGTAGFCLKGSPGWLKGARIYRNTFTVDPSSVYRTEKLNIELWNICQDSEVYGNTFNNGYLSFVSGQKLAGTTTFTFHDNVINNGIKSEFSVSDHRGYRNRFVHYGHTDNDMGSGIGIWPSNASAVRDLRNIQWSYNEFIDMYGQVIDVQDKVDDGGGGPASMILDRLDIFNNVFDGAIRHGIYSAAISVSADVATSSYTNLRMDNNIFTGVDTAVLFNGTTRLVTGEVANNLFYLVARPWAPPSVPTVTFEGNLQNVNPLFRDASARDYTLAPDSPCRDAGKDMGYTFYEKYGSAYDIGAHEYIPPDRPVADAGPDRAVLAGETVTLTGLGSSDPQNDPLTYRWRQVQGQVVTLSDPSSATPFFTAPEVAAPVALVFELVVDDGAASSLPDLVTITVNPANSPPTAGFSATPLSGTSPLSVSFTDTSTGTVTGWQWAFGDSGTSTERNPVHVYAAAGTYTVSLTVTGPGGAHTATRAGYIVVTAPVAPTVAITAPATGAAFAAPATIAMAAVATAGEGAAVSRVDFYSGANLIGTATSAPYAATWTAVPAGSYSLTARVTDSRGGTAESSPVAVTVTAAGLPVPWESRDIGSVGITGSASHDGSSFSIRGAGGDIWYAADAFRYVYQPLSGNGQIVARVASQQNTDPWAKAGVMIRETLAANSRHAFMAVTPGSGSAFQRRTTTGGYSSHTSGPAVAAPHWVKIVRSGSTFSGYVSADGSTWTLVGSATISMTNSVYIGLAVTSHTTAALGTAVFDGVGVALPSVAPTVTVTEPAAGATFTAPADIAVTAAVTAGTGATVGKVEFFSGTTPIGTATAAPYRITWSSVPAGSYLLSARVTDSLGATASSSPVSITVAPATGLPAPWSSRDIGSVGAPGSAVYGNGTFSITGTTDDIWGTADSFRYTYRPLTGNGQIVARVASLQNSDPWAKGGVMIRSTLAAGSPHAFMAVTPGNGAAFQRRLTTGGYSSHTAGPRMVAPCWVRLVRNGSTFSGYVSADGAAWTLVGSSTITMPDTVYVGLALSSHNLAVPCTATFDGVLP